MQLVAIDLLDIFARGVEQRIEIVVAVLRLRPFKGVDVRRFGRQVVPDLVQDRPRLLLQGGDRGQRLLALDLKGLDRLGVALRAPWCCGAQFGLHLGARLAVSPGEIVVEIALDLLSQNLFKLAGP